MSTNSTDAVKQLVNGKVYEINQRKHIVMIVGVKRAHSCKIVLLRNDLSKPAEKVLTFLAGFFALRHLGYIEC